MSTSREQTFEEVIDEHGGALNRVAAAYAPPGADRDDLQQDIALAIWRALDRFDGDCSLRTYVFRVAHNRGVDYLRKKQRRRERHGETAGEPEGGNRPDALVEKKDRHERLARCIRQLPVGMRQVMTMKLEEKPYAEIAEVVGISENAVAVRVHRAKKKLEQLMKEEESR